MGVVFKVRHRRMNRLVAVKMLPPRAMNSDEAIRRFCHEVKAAARLSHPNIVTAYDAGTHEGSDFMVMEYVEGKDLGSVLRERGPLPVAEAIQIILQAVADPEYAHEQGVVHRDIKPGKFAPRQKGNGENPRHGPRAAAIARAGGRDTDRAPHAYRPSDGYL